MTSEWGPAHEGRVELEDTVGLSGGGGGEAAFFEVDGDGLRA